MDIKAVQAEASTKATAWLTQNLTSDPEPAPASPAAPATPPAAAPPAIVPPTPTAPVTTAPVIPAKPGLADVIRQDRETRAAAAAAQGEAGKYKGEVETLRKEVERLKSVGAANDPFEFLRGRKLTKEQQALWGQAFLYDLKPEVAPQEFRLELYKAEQARKEEEQLANAEREKAEQAQLQARAHLDRYADELISHVQSSAGSNPESETWFTEDGPNGQPVVNHKVYAQSLLATADNLSRQAQKLGQQADLSPANVARVLEAEVFKRLQRRDARMAGSAKTDTKAPVAPAQGGTQATNTAATSAQGLRGGPPLPLDMSDEARKARAIAAGFGGK